MTRITIEHTEIDGKLQTTVHGLASLDATPEEKNMYVDYLDMINWFAECVVDRAVVLEMKSKIEGN